MGQITKDHVDLFITTAIEFLEIQADIWIEVDPDIDGAECSGDEDDIVILIGDELFSGDLIELFVTLAHELVHAQQIDHGRLDCNNATFDGKPFRHLAYTELPHEIEAYEREEFVCGHIFTLITEKLKNS